MAAFTAKLHRLVPYVCAVTLLLGTCLASGLTNKVLIIGIDGTMCSALAVARTPNLDSLKSNGCYSVRVVTHPVTHSAACWTSMFTGVWGDKHLVNDPGNSFTGHNLAGYPSFFKHIEAANSNLNTLCFARWSPLITVVPDADVKLSFSTDADITAETCRRLTNSNPDVFYMILLDVDSAGHTYGFGPTVTSYVTAIETADSRVGQIMAALRSRATYTDEDWLVMVLTDHGEHDNPDPEKSRVTWHIISGRSAAQGVIWPSPSIVDIAATVLTHMRVPIDPAWNLDARVEGLPLPRFGYGTNLIFNPGAEATSGTSYFTTNRGIAWWFDISTATIGAYGSNSAFPSLASPGPQLRGANFFIGGTSNSSISQRINLSEFSSDIDYPGVDCVLSGWFGGAGSDGDFSALTANFLNSAGVLLDSNTVGNVTALDRTNATGMLYQEGRGTLPTGTRFVDFVLTFRGLAGNNDASADNLSFVLTPRPEHPFALSMQASPPNSWSFTVDATSTNRLYVLQSSTDLSMWTEVSPTLPGTGGPLNFVHTPGTAPGGYYRVSCRKP